MNSKHLHEVLSESLPLVGILTHDLSCHFYANKLLPVTPHLPHVCAALVLNEHENV